MSVKVSWDDYDHGDLELGARECTVSVSVPTGIVEQDSVLVCAPR